MTFSPSFFTVILTCITNNNFIHYWYYIFTPLSFVVDKLELYSSFVQNFGNVTLDHPRAPLIVLHMYMYATNNEV